MSRFDAKYLEFAKSQPDFTNSIEAYLDWIEGAALCDCGHGCRDEIADNGAKLAALIRNARDGVDTETLSVLAEMDHEEFKHQLHDAMLERVKAKRASKD